jgi:hypothetical protein
MVGTFRKKISEIGEEYGLDLLIKDLVGGAFKNAGKGKDELIQTLGREIGLAWAAVLKEPLQKIVDNRSLQITIELVPRDKTQKSEKTSSEGSSSKKKTKKKVTKKKVSKKKSTK